jgi:SAM-dependent methyltransferase
MSEERRIQSAPAAPPVPDDEIPIDADPSSAPPVPPSPPIPKDRPSRRKAPQDDSPSARRVRARMTLRIPDDEVGRPTPLAQPAADPIEAMEEIKGHRIISVGPPPPDESTEAAPTPPVMEAAPRAYEREDSWGSSHGSYQPTIADIEPAPITPRDLPRFDADVTGEYATPISEEIPVSEDNAQTIAAPPDSSSEHLDLDDVTPFMPPVRPPPPKAEAKLTRVALPPPSPLPTDLPPVRPRMSAIRESDPVEEDVRFDEDELPAPTESQPEFLPLPMPDRKSEPGEAAEIAPEDLLAVESAPRKSPPTPPMRPKAKSYPPPPASTPPQSRSPVPGPVAPTQPSTPPINATPLTAPLLAGPLAAMVAAQPQPLPAAPSKTRLIVPNAPGLAPPAMTLEAAQRKRTRPWWEELFNDDFIRASAKLTDAQIATEVSFIEESLGVARDGGVVLDLACGMGLHAIELARRGYHVVGFDLSLAMLARAADEAQERGVKLNFLQGDMRDMTFDEAFDGVFSWSTSFGYFEEEKNAQVISRVHKALKPGGVFLLDVINRDYIIRQSPSLAWFEGEGCVCMDEMQVDFITSRMRVKRTMMLDDGRTKEIDYSIRVYSLHELGKILHEQGFKVAEVSGRVATPGVFFGNESPRTLILAEKR